MRVVAVEDRLEHYVVWHCAALESSEYASLIPHQDGYELRGTAVFPLEGVPCLIEYEVAVDLGWSAVSADARVSTPEGVGRIRLTSEGSGRWTLGGQAAPHLAGCTDLDLGWTPATNTVPIRRLDPEIGESVAIIAAWIRVPELDVVANDQRYTRLAADRWRYRSGDYDFELLTDVSSGLVLEYGEDLWRAAATSSHPVTQE